MKVTVKYEVEIPDDFNGDCGQCDLIAIDLDYDRENQLCSFFDECPFK